MLLREQQLLGKKCSIQCQYNYQANANGNQDQQTQKQSLSLHCNNQIQKCNYYNIIMDVSFLNQLDKKQNRQPEVEIPQSKSETDSNAVIKFLFEKQYQLIFNPRRLMICILILFLIFLVLTVLTTFLAFKVKQIQVFYAKGKKCDSSDLETQKCSITFQILKDMEGPVFMLYSLKNAYINHRKFINSYNADQLNGKVITVEQAKKDCGLIVYNRDIPQKQSWAGKKLNPDDVASLCGVKPQGFFNDTFSIYQNGNKMSIDQSRIYEGSAIQSHRSANSEETQWVDPENKHFKSYMLDGSLLTKRRLWGVIKEGLKKGKYEILANNNFAMANMKIHKGILLTTSTVMGGRQFFYSVAFGASTIICFSFYIFVRMRFPKVQSGGLNQRYSQIVNQ